MRVGIVLRAPPSSIGVRSAPPPNQALVVTTKRVFMWTAGTCGFCGCAISEMPEAQKCGSASAPGISLRNSGANSPCTVETWTPTFSNTRPASSPWCRRRRAPRCDRCAARACGRISRVCTANGADAGSASSTASRVAQMSSRRRSNQVRAVALRDAAGQHPPLDCCAMTVSSEVTAYSELRLAGYSVSSAAERRQANAPCVLPEL